MVDTVAGQVDAFLPTIVTGLSQVESGKVRAIAVTSLKRSPLLSNVPTIAESGFPGYEVNGWYGLVAPAGTPKEVLTRLHDETAKILRMDDIKKRVATTGAEPVGNTPEEFSAYMRSEMVKWAKVVKQTGARAD